MLRLVITFFVLLSSSFTGGSNHLPSGVLPSLSFSSCSKFFTLSEFGNLQCTNKQTIESADTSGAENDTLGPTEIEEEEDVESFRKHLEISDYFLSFSPAQVSGNLHHYLKDRLPTYKHFSTILSDRYIMYQVIRV